jgi:hypothetical protein
MVQLPAEFLRLPLFLIVVILAASKNTQGILKLLRLYQVFVALNASLMLIAKTDLTASFVTAPSHYRTRAQRKSMWRRERSDQNA